MSGRIRILHVEYDGDSAGVTEVLRNLMASFGGQSEPRVRDAAVEALPEHPIAELEELPAPAPSSAASAPAAAPKRRGRPPGSGERKPRPGQKLAGSPGSRWSAERLAKFQATAARKRRQREEAEGNGDGHETFRKSDSNGEGARPSAEERARRSEAAKQRLNL